MLSIKEYIDLRWKTILQCLSSDPVEIPDELDSNGVVTSPIEKILAILSSLYELMKASQELKFQASDFGKEIATKLPQESDEKETSSEILKNLNDEEIKKIHHLVSQDEKWQAKLDEAIKVIEDTLLTVEKMIEENIAETLQSNTWSRRLITRQRFESLLQRGIESLVNSPWPGVNRQSTEKREKFYAGFHRIVENHLKSIFTIIDGKEEKE
ncbi:hypothetical protein MYX07_06710 [Patescibacteria group bacterium AH-259-L07]|nr:hypothetical protein [Patescibacteria group bacterium AH-259-L07]